MEAKKITNCPICPNHCDIEAPKCNRGKELAEKIRAGEPIDPDALRVGDGHGGNRDENSLEGLMRRCGHVLHHGGRSGDELFQALSDEEQTALKALLKKLLESWP